MSTVATQGPVEARSLSSITAIASNPPAYPRNPTHEKHDPIVLYIVRVPGSQGACVSFPALVLECHFFWLSLPKLIAPDVVMIRPLLMDACMRQIFFSLLSSHRRNQASLLRQSMRLYTISMLRRLTTMRCCRKSSRSGRRRLSAGGRRWRRLAQTQMSLHSANSFV